MKKDQEKLEDQLLDALLHEQNRGDRELAISEIEAKLFNEERDSNRSAIPMWSRRMGIIAASLALGGMTVFWMNSLRKDPIEMSSDVANIQEAPTEASELNEIPQHIDPSLDALKNKLAETIIPASDEYFRNHDGAAQIRTQIESLLRYEDEQLLIYASGLDLPDNIVKTLYPEYLELKRQIGELKAAGLGDSHPTVLTNQRVLASIKQQLDQGIVDLRLRLQAQLERTMDHLAEDQLVSDENGFPELAMANTSGTFAMERDVSETPAPKAISVDPQLAMRYRLSELDSNSFAAGSGAGESLSLRSGDSGGTVGAAVFLPSSRHVKPIDLPVPSFNTERYGALTDPSWQRPTENPLSTFSVDVDTASYANIRRLIREGRPIPEDAVRIEECINAFRYQYEQPAGDDAFAVHTELATCPWTEGNLLLKVGIKGREIAQEKRSVSNLVFLIDVSGLMQGANKLPLVKESLKLLVHRLDERDSVSYVVYAGSEGVVLPPTNMTESGRVKALEALDRLESGGSTNGGAGIKRAYQLAQENFIEGGVNRVILASDGDFNVGVTGQGDLMKLVKERAAKNIYLSALAFGTGNLNDAMFESISNDGNGNYFYIDSIRESRKVFLENLTGTLITIAKDLKIQVEFNPQKVGSYRLIGYANRVLKDEDFNNDKVDAGDIGAGHTVTAFYEIAPAGKPQPNGGGIDTLKYQKAEPAKTLETTAPSDEWLTLKLRHKHPEGDISALQESVVKGEAIPWQDAGRDFQFATAVAIFGMKLRGMEDVSDVPWDSVIKLAKVGLEDDENESRAEFTDLIGDLKKRSQPGDNLPR